MNDEDISQSSTTHRSPTPKKPKSNGTAKANWASQMKKQIKQGHQLYPKLCAELCARHTANIIQEGNPNNVCICRTEPLGVFS